MGVVEPCIAFHLRSGWILRSFNQWTAGSSRFIRRMERRSFMNWERGISFWEVSPERGGCVYQARGLMPCMCGWGCERADFGLKT